MQQFLQQMVDAIHIRQSHRHFTSEPLLPQHNLAIQEFIDSLAPPFQHTVKISYHTVPDDIDIVYFKGPKQFIALESERTIDEQAKLGFLGELIVLYCESIGVRTCWMGHYKKNQVQNIVYGAAQRDNDRQLYCIILIGYTPEKTGLMDRISKKRFSKKTREIDSFFDEKSLREFPKEIKTSFELASKAPSAMNSQKWYYLVSMIDNDMIVELGKKKNYRHFKWPYYDIDVGTASAHFWLGLRAHKIASKVECFFDEGGSFWIFHC